MKLAVSACLLGQRVRYDGGHKLLAALDGSFGGLVEFLPLCPESQAGLPKPREPVELFRAVRPTSPLEAVRALGLKTGHDYTDQLSTWAKARLSDFNDSDILGFVLKSGSPSCGTEVRINPSKNATVNQDEEVSWGSGLFVAALKEGLPLSEFNSQLEPFICAAAPDLAPQMAALAQAATTDGRWLLMGSFCSNCWRALSQTRGCATPCGSGSPPKSWPLSKPQPATPTAKQATA